MNLKATKRERRILAAENKSSMYRRLRTANISDEGVLPNVQRALRQGDAGRLKQQPLREGYASELLRDSLASAGLFHLLPEFTAKPKIGRVIEMRERLRDEEDLEAPAAAA